MRMSINPKDFVVVPWGRNPPTIAPSHDGLLYPNGGDITLGYPHDASRERRCTLKAVPQSMGPLDVKELLGVFEPYATEKTAI